MKKILKIKCVDKCGLISSISTVLSDYNINIIRLNEYVDPNSNIFFFRAEIEGENFDLNLESIITKRIQDAKVQLLEQRKKKVVILATKEAHCIGDLFLRAKTESLNIEIQSVIANHEDLKELTSKFEIPFHFVSHEGLSREEHTQNVIEQINKYGPDYIILAKYMRILPESFVNSFKNKVINIHHSFLPAFIGARPYEQAYKRGVKMIGATSHFVTTNLDEGPIIEQNILPIDHSYNAQELSALGKDVEQLVLSKALKYVTEDRVFIHENKTIVFK